MISFFLINVVYVPLCGKYGVREIDSSILRDGYWHQQPNFFLPTSLCIRVEATSEKYTTTPSTSSSSRPAFLRRSSSTSTTPSYSSALVVATTSTSSSTTVLHYAKNQGF